MAAAPVIRHSVLDLGKAIKAKYPGQYDDVEDLQLGKAIKTQHPEDYADFDDFAGEKDPRRPGSVSDYLGNNPVSNYVKETLSNVPSSGRKFIGDTVDTGKMAWDALKRGPGRTLDPNDPPVESVDLQKVGEYLGNRYVMKDGKLNPFGATAESFKTDPIGVLSDVSSVAGLGEMALPRVGAYSAARTLGKVSSAANPLEAASSAIGRVSGPARQATGEWFAKQGTAGLKVPIDERPTMARRVIKDQTPLTEGGRAKSLALNAELQPRIEAIIDALDTQGAKIDMNGVLAEMGDVYKKFKSTNPAADTAAIDKSIAEFVDTYGTPSVVQRPGPILGPTGQPIMVNAPGPNIPGDLGARVGQDLKKVNYKVVKDKAFTGEQKTAAVESLKAQARGLKKELERLANSANMPDLEDLNRTVGERIKLQDAVQDQPLNLASPVIAGAVGHPTSAAYGLGRVLHDPRVYSNLGIGIAPGPWRSDLIPGLLKYTSPASAPGRVSRETRK